MTSTVVYNEPAWKIDLIGELNRLAGAATRPVRRAGGEATITGGRALFPDVLLFGDAADGRILQGWELKFPDTPIDDADLLANAAEKADRLHLDSFVVWNVREAVLHGRSADGEFEILRRWQVPHVTSRADARQMSTDDWAPVAAEILAAVNDLLETGRLEGRRLIEAFDDDGVLALLLANRDGLAEHLRATAATDALVDAEAQLWWRANRLEYPSERVPWRPLAGVVLLSWANRLVFTHVLKRFSSAARAVDGLTDGTTPADALAVFARVTDDADFAGVFHGLGRLDLLDGASWRDLLQLNAFLVALDLRSVDQGLLHEVLQRSVAAGRRKAAGQYATPPVLADLLVRLVLRDKAATFLDPCCGTGTISRAAMHLRAEYGIPLETAMDRTWASDKFAYPLQLASMALADPRAMGRLLRVFAGDVSELESGRPVAFVDPDSGQPVREALPRFAGVASNLPFVRQEDVEAANPGLRDRFAQRFGAALAGTPLPARSDLSAYLPFFVGELMEPDGVAGFVLSNAMLGTDAGARFRRALQRCFQVEAVMVSAAGRWFANADVVTCVLVLRRRSTVAGPSDDETTTFCSVSVPLTELHDPSERREAAAGMLLGVSTPQVEVRSLPQGRIAALEDLGLGWTALFADWDWLDDVLPALEPVDRQFVIERGERRGWNAMFYPAPGHGIEDDYLAPVLTSSRGVEGMLAEPDSVGFFCSRSEEHLRGLGHTGALAWIERFRHQTNGTGRPLPQVLARAGRHWYEMRDDAVADLVSTVNPGSRLFVARMTERRVVDQRLTRFTARQGTDVALGHALLNSTVGMLWLEALGFGRGLGALDLSPTRLRAGLRMPAVERFDDAARARVLDAFAPLRARPVVDVRSELQRDDRAAFDHAVFEPLGALDALPAIRAALERLYRIRMAALDR